MIETETPLETIYQGWEIYQRRLTNAIAALTPEQLALRAAPQLWSIGVLAAHIIAARIWWFHHILGEGNAELAELVEWDDDGAPSRTAAELADALEASWQLARQALDHWTPTDLAQPIQRQGVERVAFGPKMPYNLHTQNESSRRPRSTRIMWRLRAT